MKIVILYHLAKNDATGYDVFVKKSIFDKWTGRIEKLKMEIDFQDIACSHVCRFLKQNSDYIFLGSEDTNHIESKNEEIRKIIYALRCHQNTLFIPSGYGDNLKL